MKTKNKNPKIKQAITTSFSKPLNNRLLKIHLRLILIKNAILSSAKNLKFNCHYQLKYLNNMDFP